MGNSLSNTALFRPTEPSYKDDLKNLVFIPELMDIDVDKFLEDKRFEIFNKEENIKELSKKKFPAIFLYSKKLKTKHTIMYFHSNSCDLGQIYDEMCNLYDYLHVNILAIEYVGFGLCYLEGSPNQYNINRRALAAYNFLRSLNLKSEQILLFGRSIGTGVATKLGYNLKLLGDNVGGIILHSPYISIEKLVEEYVTYSSYIIENIYDNFKNLSLLSNNDDSDTPLLLIHGKEDEVIGVSHSEFLMKNLNNKFKTAFYPSDSYHNYYYVIDDLAVPTKTFLDKQSKSRHEKSVDIVVPKSFFKIETETHKITHREANARGSMSEKEGRKSEDTLSAYDMGEKKKENSMKDIEKKKNGAISSQIKNTIGEDSEKREKQYKENCTTKSGYKTNKLFQEKRDASSEISSSSRNDKEVLTDINVEEKIKIYNKYISNARPPSGKDITRNDVQINSNNSEKKDNSNKDAKKNNNKINVIISSINDAGLKNLKNKDEKKHEVVGIKATFGNDLEHRSRNNHSGSASDSAIDQKKKTKIISDSENKYKNCYTLKKRELKQEMEERKMPHHKGDNNSSKGTDRKIMEIKKYENKVDLDKFIKKNDATSNKNIPSCLNKCKDETIDLEQKTKELHKDETEKREEVA
ncbi:alpha/beta hydrolase [Plasmodium gonderi]|uniref:Alpha/beta hydrolase n=1 Tax=Plasmodium gonderi TaxID=77519 RepID=A0A1Y1J9J4_PLAGO|nr:alpha/beta hydrolase [Plasmodium gonderi]GAW79171.1 alpha/beta hydrolase [Plasmodium gonderi]